MSANTSSLQSLLRTEAAADPAFVFDGTPVSRAEFAGQIEQTAAWLAAQGIGKGDVVAVWLVNRIEWLALLFAAARCGAIVAAVNTRYRSAEVAHLLRLSGARLMVVEAAFRSIDFAAILADIARDEVPALQKLAVVGADAMAAHWPCVRFDAFDKAYPPAPLLRTTSTCRCCSTPHRAPPRGRSSWRIRSGRWRVTPSPSPRRCGWIRSIMRCWRCSRSAAPSA